MADMALGVFILKPPTTTAATGDEVKWNYDIMKVLRKSNDELMAIRGLLLKVALSQAKESRKDSKGILGEDASPYRRNSYKEMRVLDDIAMHRSQERKNKRFAIERY